MTFSNSTFHSSYHPLREVDTFISDLAKGHPDLVELITIGRTAEQREMTAVKISSTKKTVTGGENEAPLKPKGTMVFVGAQHAREVCFPRGHLCHATTTDPVSPQWIAVSTALYLAHGLVAEPGEHYSLNGLLRHYVRLAVLLVV